MTLGNSPNKRKEGGGSEVSPAGKIPRAARGVAAGCAAAWAARCPPLQYFYQLVSVRVVL